MGSTSFSCKIAVRMPDQTFQFWPVRAASTVPGGIVKLLAAADLMCAAETVGSVGALPPAVPVAPEAAPEEPIVAPDVPEAIVECVGCLQPRSDQQQDWARSDLRGVQPCR